MTKTAIQLAIAILVIAILIPANSSMGQTLQLKFDLVKDIKDNLLIEPLGELVVSVDLKSIDNGMKGKKAKINNLRLQSKFQKSAQSTAKEIAADLKKQIIATDKAVKKIMGKKKVISEAQLGKAKLEVLLLNKYYLLMSEQAQKEVGFEIARVWDEEVRNQKTLRNFKLTVAYEFVRDAFKLGRGIAEATATSGVMLPIEIKGILESSMSIAKNIRRISKSEDSARKALIKAATAVRKKMGGVELTNIERVIDNLKGLDTDLEDALFLYQRKLLQKNANANTLSESIAKSFIKEDRLIEEDRSSNKTSKEAIEKIQEIRDKQLKLIDATNKEIETGNHIQKELTNLLTQARKDWKPADRQKYVELGQKIDSLASDLLGMATLTDAALTLLEKAGDEAIKKLGKIKE